MTRERKGRSFPLALAVNTAGFLLGAAGGFLLAVWLEMRNWMSLNQVVAGYAIALEQGQGIASLPALLWDAGRWPLMAWLLGFTGLGLWMLPALFAARGFFFAFCVAGLSSAMEGGGLLLAILLYGWNGLFTIPIFFTLGAQSWEACRGLRGRLLPRPGERGPYSGAYWFKSLVGLGGVIVCALTELWLLPPILRALLPVLTGRS